MPHRYRPYVLEYKIFNSAFIRRRLSVLASPGLTVLVETTWLNFRLVRAHALSHQHLRRCCLEASKGCGRDAGPAAECAGEVSLIGVSELLRDLV